MNTLPKITLASRSPRRRMLLEACGFPLQVVEVDFDESVFPPDLDKQILAQYLARGKATAAVAQGHEGIILAADSIVLCDDEVLGKPANRDDALRILRLLSNKTHLVITGVCILDAIRKIEFSEVSLVTFATLSEAEITFYIDQYEPYDKAGAYAIQEWIGHCKITRIEGSYTNIMGLPTERVYHILRDW